MKEPKEIWEAVLGELQVQVSKPNYDTWLKDTKGVSLSDDLFVISTPNTFAAEWLHSRLLSLIKNTLANIVGELIEVQFAVQDKLLPHAVISNQYDGGISARTVTSGRLRGLNPNFTFDNFITGDSNKLAFTAAREAAEDPGHIHNPLFLYSDTGLGKTHLLHAVGNHAKNRAKRVICASAEQLTSDYIRAIKNHQTDELNDKYHNVDILLLDDVQFFSGKKQTQGYFLNLFNILYDNDCQIVITCDSAPQAISSMGERMRSRLGCGLVANIKPPEYETRLAILDGRARKAKINIPPEVLQFVATHLHKNIRELEGGLNRVITYARLKDAAPDIELARQSLDLLLEAEPQQFNGNSKRSVVEAVAAYFELSPKALSGKDRDRNTTQARHIAMYILREYFELRLNEIGSLLGNRDHSTVLYGCQKISAELNVNKQLKKIIDDLCSSLKIHKNSQS